MDQNINIIKRLDERLIISEHPNHECGGGLHAPALFSVHPETSTRVLLNFKVDDYRQIDPVNEEPSLFLSSV